MSLTLSHSGGTQDDPAGDRVIVFDSPFESAGAHAFTVTDLASLAGEEPGVLSVDGTDALVDGAEYDLLLAFSDGGSNTPASVAVQGIAFTGTDTIAPREKIVDTVPTVPEGNSGYRRAIVAASHTLATTSPAAGDRPSA